MDQVNIVVGDGNLRLSSAMRHVFKSEGLTSVETVATVNALADILGSRFVDLVICDSQLPGEDLPGILQRVRHQTLGHNPFAGVVATVRGSGDPVERRLAEAGPDTVLVKPLTMDGMLEAVMALVRDRKRFVVTEAYVGPARRTGARAEENAVPPTTIDVPNTLKMRISEKLSDGEVKGQVSAVSARVSQTQFDATVAEIGRLVARIAGFYSGGAPDEADWRATLNRFLTVSTDLFKRHQRLGNDSLANLARLLRTLGERILARPPTERCIEVDLLVNVNRAIQIALSVENKAEDTMVLIASLVARFAEKDAAKK